MAAVLLNTTQSGSGFNQFQAGYPLASAVLAQVSGTDDYVYFFPFAPVATSFTQLSATYAEIERPGNYSLLSFKEPQLMQCSFTFTVVKRPGNGLDSIEDDLEMLHRIAQADKLVSIIGLGSFFESSVNINPDGGANTLFRVADLSIDIVTRGPSNEPWQANCSIQLTENRNPNFAAAATFTKIVYTDTPVVKSATKKSSTKTKTPTPPGSTVVYSKVPTGPVSAPTIRFS